MKREDDQQLWELLGRLAEPKLSPFFARNVLRQVRQEPRLFERARFWLSWRKLVSASGLALAVIAAIIALHQPGPRHGRLPYRSSETTWPTGRRVVGP